MVERSYPDTTGPVAWMVERQCDPTFPRLFMSHRDATALLNYCNVSPLPTMRPLYLGVAQASPRPPAGGDSRYLGEEILELQDEIKGLRAELEAKRGALEFYAKLENWSVGPTGFAIAIEDKGELARDELVSLPSTERHWPCIHGFASGRCPICAATLPGHDETMANLDALTLSSTPRCTCAAIVNPNIPHARSCPLSSTEGK